MVPSCGDVKGLDLSRLTDDEAQHVWQVIQRDFNLRKKEENRLGELKTKIMKEETKRELLEYQPKLSDSLCIRCLQPFKFLVNSKRQCLVCKLFICKSCSRFNKKEHGWVCDPCYMSRILKIGTLEWFHDNVRSRFKRFGSAKIMNLLFMRLNSDRACSQTDFREPRDDDTHSMPEVHTASLYSQEDEGSECSDGRHCSLTRKARRLLPVDPLDFKLGIKKSDDSQLDFLFAGSQEKIFQNSGSVAEENCSTTFKQVLENGTHDKRDDMYQTSQTSLERPFCSGDYTHIEQRMSQPHSLSKMSFSSSSSANYQLQRELSSNSSDDEDDSQMRDTYSPILHREPSLDDCPPQIFELKKRMSAVETLLSRLEQRMMFNVSQETMVQAEPKEEDIVDLEELELIKKLDELVDKISDKDVSSDEDEAIKSHKSLKKGAVYSLKVTGASSDGFGHRPPEMEEWKVKPDVHKSFKKQRRLSHLDLSNTTSSELSQLEGKVAMAVASVQSTKTGLTDIQKRFAALSSAGMTMDASRRRSSLQPLKVLHEFPMGTSSETRSFRKLSIM